MAGSTAQNAFAYQNLQQCVNEGKVSADIREKAYADAVQAQYRDGPRYNTLGSARRSSAPTSVGPSRRVGILVHAALAGFMIGRAFVRIITTIRNYPPDTRGPLAVASVKPLYRSRGDRAEWRTASGDRFGAGAADRRVVGGRNAFSRRLRIQLGQLALAGAAER